jgi:hypothetical protein
VEALGEIPDATAAVPRGGVYSALDDEVAAACTRTPFAPDGVFNGSVCAHAL